MPELDLITRFKEARVQAEIASQPVEKKKLLIDITEGKNFRGQCSFCDKTSFRWPDWRHVEMWYKNHLCMGVRKTSKNGKKSKTD